jgi:hypothetical protein
MVGTQLCQDCRLAETCRQSFGLKRLWMRACNPICWLTHNPVLCQAVSYKEMAESIVDALTYLGALSFDVLSFLIIERLATSGHPKIKEDGINISDWLQVRLRPYIHSCVCVWYTIFGQLYLLQRS